MPNETTSMNRFVVILVCLGMCAFATPSSSQVSGASVSLDCGNSTHVPIDPIGIQNYTFECTVSNPTAYVEKIAIQTTSDGLATHAPGDIYVEAGGQENFTVSILWNPGMYNEERQITVSAQVQELNNLPPPNSASSQYSGTLDLNYNYSQNGCFTIGTLPTMDFIVLEMDNPFGNITLKLNHSESPISAMNFQLLAAMGCLDNTTFHRVIDDFMIQGGDFTNGDGTGGHAASWQGFCNGQAANITDCTTDGWTIPDEANNLTHVPFSLSMAKTSAPNTGGSQFFIIDANTTANWLDGVHTVFGTVVEGQDTVESIASVSTGSTDRPTADVVILRAHVSNQLNSDTDADGIPNDDDNCPDISNPQQIDTDADSMGDECDGDIDGDGVNNDEDEFPTDVNETADYDGDGIGDNADLDDDGDGMNDTSDAFPYDQNETTDTDGDGIGDNSDADDDGDGVADTTDNCPYTANTDQADADNDGIGTACDGSEEETETPSVPALGLFGSLLAICIALVVRKNH